MPALAAIVALSGPAHAASGDAPVSAQVDAPPVTATPPSMATADDRRIILAVEDRGEPLPGAGGSARGDYRRMAGYAGSARALAMSEALAREYGLREQAAWTIAPLNLRCMLYALGAGDDVDAVLARLRQDTRVKLAQPLNEFETLAGPAPDVAPVAPPRRSRRRHPRRPPRPRSTTIPTSACRRASSRCPRRRCSR
ncbi:hypothetical protein ACQ859_00785 [Roseateles chitinivorans]|uniref:hypothetical protein n=1 Tax=Roseateles chitinivorans TaxID=2917965 RepID=UPI003D676BBE